MTPIIKMSFLATFVSHNRTSFVGRRVGQIRTSRAYIAVAVWRKANLADPDVTGLYKCGSVAEGVSSRDGRHGLYSCGDVTYGGSSRDGRHGLV